MGTNMENKPDIGFDKIIDALLDLNNTFPPKYLHRFSDISPMDLSSLQKVWNLIVASRKVTLLEDLEAISDSDTLTSFFDVGRLALTDSFPPVRELGIRLLWECEEHSLVKIFLKMLNNDPDINVQAAVASALGRFINLGELDVIPGEERDAIEQALIPKFDKSNPQLIRRRAIESLGYSSTPAIDKLIKKAYSESDKTMVASALFAMGRSANDAWAETVISNLQNQNVDVQEEAVRAAGELELQNAREEILELLDDEGLDLDVFLAAIWSLSQIGGPGVQEKLEALAEDPDMDEETVELIESAAENLDFNNSLVNFNLLDISPEEDEDEEV
jgi:HEAT repeat protein